MKESINSNYSSNVQNGNSNKMESLLKSLNNLNLDNKNEVTREEIKYFFSQLLPLDKNNLLSEKIISFLDIQTTITIEDFVNGFIQFDTELKKSLSELNNKLLTEQDNLNNYTEQCKKYKNEKLNEEGFCPNSKLTIRINNIDIKSNSDINQIIIEIKYSNETDQKIIDINEDHSAANFEFIPKNRNENFIITIKKILNGKEFILGYKEFPMEEITTQEEYIADIDIPDINDDNIIVMSISAKIMLYWSDYQFFYNKRNNTELRIKKIENVISEINKYLTDIDLIYKKNIKINDTDYDNIHCSNHLVSPSTIDTNKINLKNGKNDVNRISYNEGFQEINFPKRINYTKKYHKLKVLTMSFLFLGIINGIFRNEFHNILGSLLFLLSCYNHYWMDTEKYINLFKFDFYFCMVLITYDVIWMLNNFGFEQCYWCGTDDIKYKLIKLISLGIVGGSIILKSLCSIQLYTNMKILMNEV